MDFFTLVVLEQIQRLAQDVETLGNLVGIEKLHAVVVEKLAELRHVLNNNCNAFGVVRYTILQDGQA